MRPRRLLESQDRDQFAVELNKDFKKMHAKHKTVNSKPLTEGTLITKAHLKRTNGPISKRKKELYMYCARRTLD